MSSHVEVRGHTLNPVEVQAHMDLTSREAADGAEAVLNALAAEEVPVASGRLLRATHATKSKTVDGWTIDLHVKRTPHGGVTSRQVAQFVEGGTGVYHGAFRITPKKSKALNLGGGVFLHSVAGQKANPFMRRIAERAHAAVPSTIFEVIDRNY